MKYQTDQWVLYYPFPDVESEILSSQNERALILSELPNDHFYDYKIIIETSGKIKKVREHQLFPEPHPTY